MLDDAGVRPPLIAAGINLFGGPLGLIHKHITGAIPIRRNTKDPAYLITLKAYVAEILKKHDLFLYPEGGRSYSGELKTAKTGLIHAALTADQPSLVVVPVGIAYDLVLEDHILARQGVKKLQRPFTRELAEMVRYAVGYRTRVFVTFGPPISTTGCDTQSRSDVLELTRLVRNRMGALYKVLPTAVFSRRDAAVDHQARSRVAHRSPARRAQHAPGEPRRHERPPRHRRSRPKPSKPAASSCASAAGSVSAIAPSCATTHARSNICWPRPPSPTDARQRVEGALPPSRTHQAVQDARVAVRDAAFVELRAPVHRRRNHQRKPSTPRASWRRRGLLHHARPSRRERRHPRARRRRHARILRGRAAGRRQRHRPEHLAQADAARADRRSRDVRRQPATRARSGGAGRVLHPHRHGGLGAHRGDARHFRNAVGPRPPSDGRRAAGGPLSNRGGSAAGPQAGRAGPPREGRLQGAEDRRLPEQAGHRRCLCAADEDPAREQRISGDRHARPVDARSRDSVGRRARPRAGPIRVSAAVRRAARPAGVARVPRLPGPRLYSVRTGMVSVLHATAWRAAGERDVGRQEHHRRTPRRI